jgi:hypothetical protein
MLRRVYLPKVLEATIVDLTAPQLRLCPFETYETKAAVKIDAAAWAVGLDD